MKIALGQINTTVGAIGRNADKVIATMEAAKAQGADLLLLPELTLTGYPPKDLVHRPSFVTHNLEALERVVLASASLPAVVVGFVDHNTGGEGAGLFNAAAFCAGGQLQSVHRKTLLPTYDVFDEGRYFDPAMSNPVAEYQGLRLGISICEDIWNDALYWRQKGRRRYKGDPIEDLASQGFDLLVNISASPFAESKRHLKKEMLAATARRYGKPVIQVNLVGGNDSLIFDGWSNVFGPEGDILAQAKDFAEDLLIYDTELGGGRRESIPDDEIGMVCNALVLGLQDYVAKCRFQTVVVGLSGGIDSAVVATLAARALGSSQVFGVAMPSPFSSQHSVDDARALAKNLGIDFRTIPISGIFESYLGALAPHFEGKPFGQAEENLQARIRGNLLMALSNKFGHLVLSTGNKSELAVGYCTLYGDMSGGLAVISDVPKTMVYQLAEHLNRDGEKIPRNSIEKAPSAELRPNQFDTDSLPPYDILDPIIRAYVEEHFYVDEITERGFDRSIVERVIRMIENNEYKRQQAAIGLKVTSRAFGYGRRMPVARGRDNG